jgi:alkanesulfonate monooxygenase SsuD/methylene tetrahydromethanopterin reductase-like flavin-dependent oxidoreductase (luciferase family)
MRYSLNLPNGGACADARTLAELAHDAEEAGWDGVFLEDYIVYQGVSGTPTFDPWVALAAMALRTNRILLGTDVTPLPRRRPWKLARETVTLDHLSNGRLVLCVGLGDSPETSFTHFGEVTDTRQRARMLDEALDVLVGLWSGEPFQYHGDYYHVEEVVFLPRPLQIPRIPIWVGGGYPRRGPMQRAARWDGTCIYQTSNDGVWSPAEVLALKAFIASRRSASTPFDIVLGGKKRGEDWEQERALISSLAQAGATWWTEWIPPAELEVMRACIQRGPLRID